MNIYSGVGVRWSFRFGKKGRGVVVLAGCLDNRACQAVHMGCREKNWKMLTQHSARASGGRGVAGVGTVRFWRA